MRAVVCESLTGLDALHLRDLPAPEPGPGEIGLRVRAAGLNFADSLSIKGQYQEGSDPPFVPGLELVGTVERLGARVEGFAPGQRVIALVDRGAFAEHAVARVQDCLPVPAAVPDDHAAGFAIAYGTAHGALRWRGQLQPGETLLVFGAAGGVGLSAVEIGKALGATVIACARGTKAEVARDYGADHVLDSEAPDLLDQLKTLAPAGVNVVFDPVGGAAFEAAMKVGAPAGRILIIGFASGIVAPIKANHLLVKNLAAIGFYWGAYRRFAPQLLTDGLREALDWAAEGRLRPHVSHRFALDAFRAAYDCLLARRNTGKIVLQIAQPD